MTVDEIEVGDRVAYQLSTGDRVGRVVGKVLGIFNTQDGQTLADVEWTTLGPPRRLSISRLIKI
jgi:hypothetical protein